MKDLSLTFRIIFLQFLFNSEFDSHVETRIQHISLELDLTNLWSWQNLHNAINGSIYLVNRSQIPIGEHLSRRFWWFTAQFNQKQSQSHSPFRVICLRGKDFFLKPSVSRGFAVNNLYNILVAEWRCLGMPPLFPYFRTLLTWEDRVVFRNGTRLLYVIKGIEPF